MCFAFSSWRDSLTSAQATLGAKPNHGFFHCQHPDAKKIARRFACAPRAVHRGARMRRAPPHARMPHARDAAKRNIFFSAVLSHAPARRHPKTARRRRAPAHPQARMKAGESASFDVRRNGPDFASHKPECAELREQCAASDGAIGPAGSAMRTRSTCDRRMRDALADAAIVASHGIDAHGDGQEKSRPRWRTASRCRRRGGAPRAGRGQCSSSSSSSA